MNFVIDSEDLKTIAEKLGRKFKPLNEEKAYKFLTIDFEPAFSDTVTPLFPDEQSRVVFLREADGMTVVYQFKKIDKKELKRRVSEVVKQCKENNTRVSAKKVREEELRTMLAEAPEQEKVVSAFETQHGWAFPGLHGQVLKAVGFGSGPNVSNLTKMWKDNACPSVNVTLANEWTRTFKDDEDCMAVQSQEEGGEVMAFEYGSGIVQIAKNGVLMVKCLPSLLEEILTEVYASQ